MAERVCPVWVGYLLVSPLRKLAQNPHKILSPYIEPGMKVVDVGCGMGFFSIPLAYLVGLHGKVICVDLQKKMLTSLERRARKAGVLERIETRLCQSHSLDLDDVIETIDFVLAFAVVHEVPDASTLFSELFKALKPQGKLLVAEPKGHVSENHFELSVSVAENNGFRTTDRPQIGRSRAVVLEKKINKST